MRITGLVLMIVTAAGAALAGAVPGARPAPPRDSAKAIFAGGCFWCVEEAFDAVTGVVSTTSGYTGGSTRDPSYEEVTAGVTGHAEAVLVVYDPTVTSYSALLDVFWHNVDPTDAGGQFCDRGDSYRSAIFTRDDEQHRLAAASKRALEESGRFDEPIATGIVRAGRFYEAESYHQNYYQKNPIRYKLYKWNCRRAQRLEQIWGEKP